MRSFATTTGHNIPDTLKRKRQIDGFGFHVPQQVWWQDWLCLCRHGNLRFEVFVCSDYQDPCSGSVAGDNYYVYHLEQSTVRLKINLAIKNVSKTFRVWTLVCEGVVFWSHQVLYSVILCLSQPLFYQRTFWQSWISEDHIPSIRRGWILCGYYR